MSEWELVLFGTPHPLPSQCVEEPKRPPVPQLILGYLQGKGLERIADISQGIGISGDHTRAVCKQMARDGLLVEQAKCINGRDVRHVRLK